MSIASLAANAPSLGRIRLRSLTLAIDSVHGNTPNNFGVDATGISEHSEHSNPPRGEIIGYCRSNSTHTTSRKPRTSCLPKAVDSLSAQA